MTLKEFYILVGFQIALYAVVSLLAFIRLRRRDKYVLQLGVMFALSFVFDILMFLLPRYLKVNANYASAVYHILALPIVSMIYYSVTGNKGKGRFAVITLLYSLFAIVNVLFIQQQTINSYTMTIMSIIVLIYCLYYFYWLMKELPTTNLHKLPMFWINSAFMVYYAGNLFLFVFTPYLVDVLKDNLIVYWSLHNFLGTVEMSIIIFALWIDLKRIKSQSS